MTQRIWTIVDESTGLTKVTVTADTDVRGVSCEFTPVNWMSHAEVDIVVSTLNTANAWMVEQGVV